MHTDLTTGCGLRYAILYKEGTTTRSYLQISKDKPTPALSPSTVLLMWKTDEICCIRKKKKRCKTPRPGKLSSELPFGKKCRALHWIFIAGATEIHTGHPSPSIPTARMICKCSGKGCSAPKPSLQQTEQDYLYTMPRASNALWLQTLSHQALLSCWQSSLGQAAASDGSCCSKDMWYDTSEHPESPASLLRGWGCQRGLRQCRKVRDAPAGPCSHPARETEEMAAPLTPPYPTVLPSECLLPCTLPVLESPASLAASLGSAQRHPASARFGSGMCCGDVVQIPDSSATLLGPH